MRWLAAFLALPLALAGCSDGAPSDGVADDGDDFGDLGVRATDTKGVLLGVVVDEAIRPIAEAQVSLRLPDGSANDKVTDAQGRFAYGGLDPGTYFIEVRHLLYTSAQTSAEVKAGDPDPPVHRVQLTRLFAQEPFSEAIKFDGYLACAYSAGVSSTCVNDYTRLAGAVCPGGCLKEYDVARQAGNIREYRTNIGTGWQVLVFEMAWEPSSQGLGNELGVTVSYFNRTSTGHWYGNGVSESPLRLQFNVGSDGPNQSGEPEQIPPEGLNDLFVFFGAGDLAVNQQFQSFQTNFYYGLPPEGWSFVNGDPIPF